MRKSEPGRGLSVPRTGWRARIADRPARILLLGYLFYAAVGWGLLMLPVAQSGPVAPLDALFIATSAVSTTGLVTVDPGSSFTFFGEIVILALIQLGGLGYMTIGSVALLVVQHRISRRREAAARAAFELPSPVSIGAFLRAVFLFTFLVEAAGAAILYPMFLRAGVESPLWAAIFHSVSAFCTAGFSLFATSLEGYVAHPGVSLTVAALSILGAMGFLIAVDIWRTLLRRRVSFGFTTRIIVSVTLALIGAGTVLLALFEPTVAVLPWDARLLAAFFQAMTAATTVGFNTVPIGNLAVPSIMVLLVLMVVGASPAGTGGGIKTTAFATLFALVRCTLRGRRDVLLFGHRVPAEKMRTATATFAYYIGFLVVASGLLAATEAGAAFEHILFEAVSAMSTVGLSMGLTGALSEPGKILVIVLMTAGRLGILTFGIAIARTRPDDTAAPQPFGP
ncbi:TrkH family potassium uptake protein [Histidinibacterium lentulum]|uniref:Potassium transporter KtrB n=1 Tax=Histidinibacterium lentulum TaxID=2480588 RepID=A0A3N2QUT8_9RHOB|nr:potassium transporter TrkG [Histidinibacterium lentulum]ROT98984.1 potassium transporter KtrB [Histidinibacterium lentulum]